MSDEQLDKDVTIINDSIDEAFAVKDCIRLWYQQENPHQIADALDSLDEGHPYLLFSLKGV